MWFWWAIASAVTSAISITYNKRVLNGKIHTPLLSWGLFAFSIIPAFIILSVTGDFPKINYIFVLAMLAAGVIFSYAKTLQLKTFKENQLSDVIPLQAIAPLSLYVLGLVFLSEQLKLTAVLGIIISVVGVYVLNYRQGVGGLFDPFLQIFKNKYSRVVLFYVLLSNLTAVAEKTAILNMSPSLPIFMILIENILITVLISGYVTHKDRFWFREIKGNFISLLIAGFLYFLLAIFVAYGFRDGPVALISSVKKLEIVFVLIISYILFGERPPKTVYIGTALMLLSVFLVKLQNYRNHENSRHTIPPSVYLQIAYTAHTHAVGCRNIP